jgi:hypothetical protein
MCGMRELRGEFDLEQEPVGSGDRRELGLQDLEGDGAVVLEVFGETDPRTARCVPTRP